MGWLASTFDSIFQDIAELVLQAMSWIVSITASVLDTVVVETVLKMGDNLERISAIQDLWVILRDFGNLIFIFILVYAAIAIILDINQINPKKTIAKVLVVALLVNFSLFFTSAIIDGSNVIALQFNNAVQVVNEEGETLEDKQASISGVFANAVSLPSVYDQRQLEEAASDSSDGSLDKSKLALIMLGGSVFLLVTAFVFLATALLLVIRFAILILLLILSPVAFIAWAIPQTKQYAEMWMDKLLSQAFFAPFMFALIISSARLSTLPDFKKCLAAARSGKRWLTQVLMSALSSILALLQH